jgi:hypothetical protein
MKISVASCLAVIGTNPECADMSNTRGEIIGEVFYIQAEDSTGRRWAGPEVSNRFRGERLAAALQRSVDKGYNPTTCHLFNEIDPAYGSAAFISQQPYLIEREKKESLDD